MNEPGTALNRRNFLATIATTTIATAFSTMTSDTAFAQNDSRHGIVGKAAPEIHLNYWIDKHGKSSEYSITSQKGKWVYLYCFQDWCPGCHSHGFPTLKALAIRFPDHPKFSIAAVQTVFEGFSTNTQDDVRKLQLKYELAIPMGHDPGDPQGDHRPQIMKNYRTGGTPWIIVIQPDGQVIFNDFHINTENFITFISEKIS